MDSRNVAEIGAFSLLTRGVTETRVETLAERLPKVKKLTAPTIEIPWIPDARIVADGEPSEDAWALSIGFSMDEDNVPTWHKIGSHLAHGTIKHGENASFWLLGTKEGLALVVEVNKGPVAPVSNKPEWHLGDCVEIFTDVKLERGKPTKQIFLAYRRPGLDRAASSAPGASVGRVRTAKGYALEALIPWADLGFQSPPEKDFGIDLQIDFGDADGRSLQMTYATGTNDAWITSERFLAARLKPLPATNK